MRPEQGQIDSYSMDAVWICTHISFFDEWDSGECCKDDPIEMETTTTKKLPTCRSVYLYVYIYMCDIFTYIEI